MNMLTIEQATELIKNNLPLRKKVNIQFDQSLGYFLAEDIIANDYSPRFDNSGMDGFAVMWDDVKDCSNSNKPELKIIGESRAGVPYFGRINRGEAIRISTGAMIPDDADTVIPIEEVNDKIDKIIINNVIKKGKHIRYKAEEINIGDKIIEKGKKISPGDIALMASFGVDEVCVFSKPRIAIIVTGSEFSTDDRIEPWQIRNSNSYMLMSAANTSFAETVYYKQVGDALQETINAISEASDLSDIILLSGGVSVGPHDHVKNAAFECGFEEIFWKIKQKPGKPLFFAKNNNALMFGLPGNPVSALSTYAFYVHPVITFLRGGEYKWNIHPYLFEGSYQNKGDRDQFLRVIKENKTVKAAELQGSHMLTSISNAYGFIIVKAGQTINKNDKVMVYYYPWSV